MDIYMTHVYPLVPLGIIRSRRKPMESLINMVVKKVGNLAERVILLEN